MANCTQTGIFYDMFLAAGASNGSYGCQVWVRAALQYVVQSVVVHAPRILQVDIVLHGCIDIIIISAHAPHELALVPHKDAFWELLLCAIAKSQRAKPNAHILLGIDSNAQVGSVRSNYIRTLEVPPPFARTTTVQSLVSSCRIHRSMRSLRSSTVGTHGSAHLELRLVSITYARQLDIHGAFAKSRSTTTSCWLLLGARTTEFLAQLSASAPTWLQPTAIVRVRRQLTKRISTTLSCANVSRMYSGGSRPPLVATSTCTLSSSLTTQSGTQFRFSASRQTNRVTRGYHSNLAICSPCSAPQTCAALGAALLWPFKVALGLARMARSHPL